MRAGHGRLPYAKGVGEVDERTNSCAGGEQESLECHLLELRKSAVTICAYKV